MPLLENTREIQNRLGTYCQTGDSNIAIDGARIERLPHYRRLVFNVIKDALSSAYPLTKKLLGKPAFEELCHTFFSSHACQEPQVFRMTGEFARFVQDGQSDLHQRYPFLGELLEFEWTEMDMYMMEDLPLPAARSQGDWQSDVIALNPESRLLQFEYPVFRKQPQTITQEDKALYYCFAFRQPNSGKIIFLDISPVVAVVLSEIATGKTMEMVFDTLAANGLELGPDQRGKILSFLLNESKNGMSLGFYT